MRQRQRQRQTDRDSNRQTQTEKNNEFRRGNLAILMERLTDRKTETETETETEKKITSSEEESLRDWWSDWQTVGMEHMEAHKKPYILPSLKTSQRRPTVKLSKVQFLHFQKDMLFFYFIFKDQKDFRLALDFPFFAYLVICDFAAQLWLFQASVVRFLFFFFFFFFCPTIVILNF